jgi:hypothetical protein
MNPAGPQLDPLDPCTCHGRTDRIGATFAPLEQIVSKQTRSALADDEQTVSVGCPYAVRWNRAPMWADPEPGARLTSELIFGEVVHVHKWGGDWCWVQNLHDGYIGYVPSACLAPVTEPPTHWVTLPMTIALSQASAKAPVVESLPMLAKVRVDGNLEAGFASVGGGRGWIYADHLRPLGDWPPAEVPAILATARRFLERPYQWGGRTALGLDCSGLVQIVLGAHGLRCPRDTDQQQAALATPGLTVPEPGDVVFFKGHVGFACEDGSLLHANATYMGVSIDPLATVIDIAGPITAITRVI